MEFLVPIVAILATFSPVLYWMKRRYDLRERQLSGEAGSPAELEAMRKERKLLLERVENLESIVCSVDYELNVRVAQIAREQSAIRQLPAAEVTSDTNEASAPDPEGQVVASARTLTALRPNSGALTDKAEELRELTAPAELPAGRVIGDRYRIERLLGRGGMGAVYLAHDEVLDDSVALKMISPAFGGDGAGLVERFRREASAARKVSHPNVIRIHDLGDASGTLYISMEYFTGRTLADILQGRGTLSLDDNRDIVGQICDGLAAAHAVGVVHRDLKPQNVLVGERNAVKLIDFGLAKTAMTSAMTATGLMVGTPYYMSPEQVRGRNVDARSDIYALGALTYHALCGRPPFQGDNPIAVGFAHCSEEPVAPRVLRKEVGERLDSMIQSALAKDPRERPQSATEFRDAL